MKLSIVIVSYNARNFLELCLSSVRKASRVVDSEIIVIDNVSEDDSCEMIQENFPEIILIKNTKNVGFSKANNQGVAIARGEYVLILNPDTVVGETTFLDILKFADTNSNLGALGVKLINGAGVYLPESKRSVPTLKDVFYKIINSKNPKGNYYANLLQDDDVGEVDILSGAFILLRTNVYKKLGGFDEDYFMYGEDIDLSFRLLKQGYKNYYLGNIKIIHFKGESTHKDVHYLKYFHRAMEIFYKKHFDSNFFENIIVKLGVKFWFLIKYFKLSYIPVFVEKTRDVLYVGNRKISIDKQINRKFNFIKFQSPRQLSDYIDDNKIEEVWLDASCISYENIIEIILMNNHKKNTFKIHVENTNYIISSNSSHGIGEIIDLG